MELRPRMYKPTVIDAEDCQRLKMHANRIANRRTLAQPVSLTPFRFQGLVHTGHLQASPHCARNRPHAQHLRRPLVALTRHGNDIFRTHMHGNRAHLSAGKSIDWPRAMKREAKGVAG